MDYPEKWDDLRRSRTAFSFFLAGMIPAYWIASRLGWYGALLAFVYTCVTIGVALWAQFCPCPRCGGRFLTFIRWRDPNKCVNCGVRIPGRQR